MANYEAPLLQSTVSTTYKTTGVLYCNTAANTARRIMVYEIEMGQTGGLSSSDCQCQWDVSRFSATNALAGSAVVPNLLDPADVSPLSLYFNNVTTELTYTGVNFGLSIKNWGINQRGSYRWRALDDGDNIIIAATAGTGVGVRVLSTSFASSAVGNISFVER
jgi:hypothetical protein